MPLLLHGVAGGWDELLIAVAAFGVLFLAVKLAGRKPAPEEEQSEEPAKAKDAPAKARESRSAGPPAAPRG